MKLSELLLIRMCCIALPIYWAVCQTHSNEDNLFYKLILPILVTLSLACFFKRTFALQCGFVFSFIVLHRYSTVTIFTENNMFTDIILSGTNWKCWIRCLCLDLGSSLKILFHFVNKFLKRYGQTRVVWYILMCICNTLLLVFMLAKMSNIIQEIQMIDIDIAFNKPIIKASPDFVPTKKMLKPLPTSDSIYVAEENHWIFNWKNEYQSFYTTKEWSYYKTGIYPCAYRPCEAEVFRYPGEDVKMICAWTGHNLETTFLYNQDTDYKLSWTFRAKDIKLSDRHRTHTSPVSVGKIGDYVILHLSSNLSIEHIENSDYGEYQLRLIFVYKEPIVWQSDSLCWKVYNRVIEYDILLGRFFLQKTKITTTTVFVPVGGLLLLENVPVISITDWEGTGLTVLHKIENGFTENSKQYDPDRLCGQMPWSGCSFLINAYYTLFGTSTSSMYKFSKIIDIVTLRSKNEDDNNYHYSLNSLSCVCANAYGVHRFVVQRNYFNRTTAKWTVIEMELPYQFLVLPRNWMFSYKNYSKYFDNENIVKDDTYWNTFLQFVPVDEEYIWNQRVVVEHCIFIIFVSELIMLLMVITKVYTRIFIVPLRNLILEGCLIPRLEYYDNTIGEIANNRGQPVFDTMVVNCLQDTGWVNRMVVPTLERMHHSVFFASRDLMPGDTRLRAYSNAVMKSMNFVIICSNNFIRDRWQNEFVFGQILNRYYEKADPKERILLIKTGPCELPDVLLVDDRVHVIDWTTHLSDEAKQNMLSAWASHHRAIANK